MSYVLNPKPVYITAVCPAASIHISIEVCLPTSSHIRMCCRRISGRAMCACSSSTCLPRIGVGVFLPPRCSSIRPPADVSIRQHTSAYVSMLGTRRQLPAYVSRCQHTTASVGKLELQLLSDKSNRCNSTSSYAATARAHTTNAMPPLDIYYYAMSPYDIRAYKTRLWHEALRQKFLRQATSNWGNRSN